MQAISHFRPNLTVQNRLKTQARMQNEVSQHSGDRVILSSTSQKRDLKKMSLFGGIGAAVGIAAAALIFPAAGIGAMALTGLLSGVAGAAVADGALETAGTGKPKPFDPYNPSHVLDPDNLYHPRNPYNPMNF
ncbi:MAG: hypothetical protein KF760_08395 [Candidatus Eremiobacteraeota bacterium]|nr:hypothetical protein [Candidatus Eremiobacteraeota bacterium]MCW5870892.1 hypothetical protein [Candidatus Eremiobacteraeota bacterium]